MTEDESRRAISWTTLAVMGVATVVMAVWGFNSLTAPVGNDSTTPTSSTTTPGCTPGVRNVVRRGDVTVSVFNAGSRSGRAQDTLNLLENAGFAPGAVGNAPSGDHVARAEVHTTLKDDPKAKLVARALGKNTRIVVTTVVGPGLDVIIGDKFNKLDASAPRQLSAASGTC